MQGTRHESDIIIALIAISLSACGGQRQPRAYGGMGELTGDDSVTIKMGQWDLIKYHSDKLGIDINYPSFLYHQDLPNEYGSRGVYGRRDVDIGDGRLA